MTLATEPSRNTCAVGCKIPMGVDLKLQKQITVREAIQGGGTRDVTEYRPVGGKVVKLKGNAYKRLKGASHDQGSHLKGGYALTFGVDKAFMDEWFKQNAESPLVLKEMIIAADKIADLEAKAKERKDILSGLEPYQKKGDPRSDSAKAVIPKED